MPTENKNSLNSSEIRTCTVLFISFSDQQNWGLNRNNRLGLNCTTDVDENWRPLFTRYFNNLLCYDMRKKANALGLVEANEELIEIVNTYQPELVIYPCVFDGLVTLESLGAIRRNGSKIAGFFFDDDIFFDQYTKYLLPYLDYFVTGSPEAVKKYSEYGVTAISAVPIPMDTAIFKKLDGVEKCFDVTFVGNPHTADRQVLLDQLNAAQVNVKTFGGTGSQRKIHYSEMVKIFNQSRINLNFSKHVMPDGRLIPQFKGRMFEVTLAGGFLLCEYVSGIETYFIPDKEIVCFKNIQEATDKIRYYLEHESERNAIAAAGYERAMRDYSGEVIVNKIFTQIFSQPGSADKFPASPLPNNLSKLYAKNYYHWTMAILADSYPLRRQWLKTAELALRMDPDNRLVRRLMLRKSIFGDPQLFTGFFKWLKWSIRQRVLAQYFSFRGKLRKFKHGMKNRHD